MASRWIVVQVALLMMVGQLGETLYLPAMPEMQWALSVSSGDIQSMVVLYLLGFGGIQFIYGPLSDAWGRRPVILWALVLFSVSALAAAWAPKFTYLQWASLWMGIGAGSGGLMCRTVMRDLYDGQALQRAVSLMSTIMVITPMAAPVMGAWIVTHYHWRANFGIFVLLGLLVLLSHLFFFPETNRYKTQQMNWRTVGQQYYHLLTHRGFMGQVLSGLFVVSGVMVYEMSAPFLLQRVFELTPLQYAWLSLVPAMGFLVGAFWAGQIQEKHRNFSMMGALVALSLMALSLWQAGQGWLAIGYVPLLALMSVMMLFSGFIFSVTTAQALVPFPEQAGMAGATLAGLQNLGCAFMGFLMSFLDAHSAQDLGLILSLGSVLAMTIYWALVYRTGK